jgi:hypothetical protein
MRDDFSEKVKRTLVNKSRMILMFQLRWMIVVGLLLRLTGIATGQMVRSETIGNDPTKEQLCALRAKKTLGAEKKVPFEIDSNYVARSRALNPDATFIAMDGLSPQLVECFLSEGTGRFEAAIFSPEQWYWHLIKPKQFQPPLGTNEAYSVAANACRKGASPNLPTPNFDHSVILSVTEINPPAGHPSSVIAGKAGERYDVLVIGKAFYRPANPDLTAINFSCLLSPMLELKAVQIK